MRLALLLDQETTTALMALAASERRPFDMEAEVLLRRVLGLSDPALRDAEAKPADGSPEDRQEAAS